MSGSVDYVACFLPSRSTVEVILFIIIFVLVCDPCLLCGEIGRMTDWNIENKYTLKRAEGTYPYQIDFDLLLIYRYLSLNNPLK